MRADPDYTYYEILGVTETATHNEIEQRYRQLARLMHPDRGGSSAAFNELTEAYTTLADPHLRARYDQLLQQERDDLEELVFTSTPFTHATSSPSGNASAVPPQAPKPRSQASSAPSASSGPPPNPSATSTGPQPTTGATGQTNVATSPNSKRSRKRIAWIIAAVSSVLLLVGTAVVVIVANIPAAALGAPGLSAYCRSYGYTGAVHDGDTVYDLYCYSDNGTRASISIAAACQWEYHVPSVDVFENFGDFDSWRCWHTEGKFGGMALPAYCQSQGYSTAKLIGPTTDDWACLSADNLAYKIDLRRACQWQYGTQDVVARPDDYHNPTSLFCWKVV